MENKITYQRLKKGFPDKYALAERYYSLLSTLNDLRLTEREIQLVAFMAIKGNININHREEFCRKHSTSGPTINNMISHLRKVGVFIKEGGKVKVIPAIVINFDIPLTMQIQLYAEY